MKIAIPVENNKGLDSLICEHFGRAPYFAIITIGDGLEVEIIPSPFVSHSPGDIPKFLSEKGVKVIIARGIGRKAELFFNDFGIKVIRGASGTVRSAVEAFKSGVLSSKDYQPEGKCH